MNYDYNQLSEMLGVKNSQISNIVSLYKIPKIVTGRKVFFEENAIEEIKKHISRFTPGCQFSGLKAHRSAARGFWKVSVFDEKKETFIVKSVCRPYEEAREIVQQLTAAGLLARYSQHKGKKYYYE